MQTKKEYQEDNNHNTNRIQTSVGKTHKIENIIIPKPATQQHYMDLKVPIRSQIDSLIKMENEVLNKSSFLKDNAEKKEEIVKIMLQTLKSLGLEEAAQALAVESGTAIENSTMKEFKQFVMSSQWRQAAEISMHLPYEDPANVTRCKFILFRQLYFESLLKSSIGEAVGLLQTELKNFAPSEKELKALSALIILSNPAELLDSINKIIYDPKSLKQQKDQQANIIAASTNSKNHQVPLDSQSALEIFSKNQDQIISSIWELLKSDKKMPPQRRLNKIIKQAICYEILKCPIHEQFPQNYSIIEQHLCKAKGFPNRLASKEKQHDDEVWHAQFSPNGLLAVSICKKSSIVLWNLSQDFEKKQSSNSTAQQSQKSCDSGSTNNNSNLCRKKKQKKSQIKLEFAGRHDLTDVSIVQCFAWNSQSDKIATSQFNKKLTVWQINAAASNGVGRIVQVSVLENAEVEPKSLVFLPDKSMLIYASDNEFIFMWDYCTNGVQKIPRNHENISIHLHPNQQDLISVCNPGRVSIVNLAKREETAYFTEDNHVVNAQLSNSGEYILLNTLLPVPSLKLWNLTTCKLENTFQGFTQTDCFLKSSMKGSYIAIGGEDGRIHIWHRLCSQHPICVIDVSSPEKIKFSTTQTFHDECCESNNKQKENIVEEEVQLPHDNGLISLNNLNEKKSFAISETQFNPVFPGMLLVASDDCSVYLFVSNDVDYELENPIEKANKQKQKDQKKDSVSQSLSSSVSKNTKSKRKNKSNSSKKNDPSSSVEQQHISNDKEDSESMTPLIEEKPEDDQIDIEKPNESDNIGVEEQEFQQNPVQEETGFDEEKDENQAGDQQEKIDNENEINEEQKNQGEENNQDNSSVGQGSVEQQQQQDITLTGQTDNENK